MGKIIALHTAALLTLAIAAAHSYLGERYILIRLFRRDNLLDGSIDTGGLQYSYRLVVILDDASIIPLSRSFSGLDDKVLDQIVKQLRDFPAHTASMQ